MANAPLFPRHTKPIFAPWQNNTLRVARIHHPMVADRANL